MKIHHRLRTKLVVVFFIITLLPALVTGIYAVHVSSKTLRTQALTTQMEQAKTLANGVVSFLATVKSDLLFLSQSPVIKEYLSVRTTITFLKSGKKASTAQSNSEQPALQTLKNTLVEKQQSLEQEFLALSLNRRIYYQVRYLDETGQEVVRVDSDGLRSQIIPHAQLQNKSNRYYFRDTMNLSRNRVFVSLLDLNREKGMIEQPHKPVIRYAVKVYDDNNQNAGIVILNVDANQFLKPLSEVRLINQEGYFLSHPDTEKCWGSPNDLGTGYNVEKEYPQLAKKILGQDGIISTNTLTLSYLQVPVASSIKHWTLIVQRNTYEILRSVTVFQTTFSIILLIAILIALSFALLFSAKITRPIEQLTSIADAISKGELVNNSVDVKDKGEIGQLAQAFERMRVSMIKSFERLRKQSQR